MTEILLWLYIPICLVAVAVLLTKRTYLAATILLGTGLALFGALSFVNIQLLQQPKQLHMWYQFVLLLQVGTTFCFYYYTKTIFRDNSEIYKGPGFWLSLALAVSLFAFCVVIPVDSIIFSPDFAEEHIVYLTKAGFGAYLLLMLYLVFGLVQLERTLASLHQLQRWNVKLEVLGSGLLLATMALYISHSLLYRSLNLNYIGWRSLVVIAAVLLIGYSRLFRSSGSKLALSRGIAHRSLVLLIVGGYLVLLGVLGEGLRYLDIVNATDIFYVLLLISGLILAVLLMSEKLRRKFKVILHKNFYQQKYDYREQWELFSEKIVKENSLEGVQAAILNLFCETLACNGASLYLLDAESTSYQYSASFNMPRDWRPFTQDDPLIESLQQKDWIINLRDSNPQLDDSLIDSLSEAGAFLVVPLYFNNELSGFIIIGEQIDTTEELTYEDFDLLRMLARQSIAALQGLRLTEQLSTSRELAAIGKVSTFVLHDLKNQVSGLSLLLDNAREYISDPEFQQDMLETVDNTVVNMKGLIARLKNLKEKPELVVAPVDLEKIVQDAATTAGGDVQISGQSFKVDADEEEIYRVILNLLINAIEASKGGTPVKVEYGCQDTFAYVNVVDSGCGMNSEFIETKLFKPFETTKKHGFGIGLYQCKQIIESHQGSISVFSAEGEGTTFTLLLPLAPDIASD